jgi:RAB protein geranylgeranyltransferase component A
MDSSIYTNIIRLGDLPAQSRQYALSLAPAFIPSLGLLITSLVASGVARYGGYKLLESTAVYAEDRSVRVVPGSKEDVFKNKDMSLVDKRRLMRFLMFAAGEFENSADLSGNEPTPFFKFLREKYALPERVAEAVTYALAFRMSPQGTAAPHSTALKVS